MDSLYLLVGAGAMASVLVLFAIYYLLAWLVLQLAERNLFWTFVEEGTARAIIRNGRFIFCVMSLSGYMFRDDDFENPPTTQVKRWDVVPYKPHGALHIPLIGRVQIPGLPERWQGRVYLPLLRNVRWIGLPPFSDAYKYRFSWTSLEEVADEKGDLIKKFNFNECDITYILVQDDVYVTKIITAECADNIPLDAVILFGGRIVNPYKALFAVERWLEATVNRIGSRTRDFFGEKKYEEIRRLRAALEAGGAAAAAAQSELEEAYKGVTDEILEQWGFKTNFVRIYQVDPGSPEARAFIMATTRLYVEEQEALANIAKGRGLASRDRQQIEAIAGVPGGPDISKWLRIAESKLTTYVEGGGAIPAIPVGGQGVPPPPTPAAPPTPTTT